MRCSSSVAQSSPHAHCRKHTHMELGVRSGAESLAQRSVLLLCPETKGLLCDGEGGVSIIGPRKVVDKPSKIKFHPCSSWCRFCRSPGHAQDFTRGVHFPVLVSPIPHKWKRNFWINSLSSSHVCFTFDMIAKDSWYAFYNSTFRFKMLPQMWKWTKHIINETCTYLLSSGPVISMHHPVSFFTFY